MPAAGSEPAGAEKDEAANPDIHDAISSCMSLLLALRECTGHSLTPAEMQQVLSTALAACRPKAEGNLR